MEMQLRQEGQIRILSLQGRLDASVSSVVKKHIHKLIEDGATQVILDLQELEFLDSSGLGGLISCLRKVKENKGEIKLTNLRPEVRSIFDITRVARLFHICKDVSEALLAFNKDG